MISCFKWDQRQKAFLTFKRFQQKQPTHVWPCRTDLLMPHVLYDTWTPFRKAERPEHPHKTGWEINWWDHKTKTPQMTKKPANPDMFQVGRGCKNLNLPLFFLLFRSRRKFHLAAVESSIGPGVTFPAKGRFLPVLRPSLRSGNWVKISASHLMDGGCLGMEPTDNIEGKLY